MHVCRLVDFRLRAVVVIDAAEQADAFFVIFKRLEERWACMAFCRGNNKS